MDLLEVDFTNKNKLQKSEEIFFKKIQIPTCISKLSGCREVLTQSQATVVVFQSLSDLLSLSLPLILWEKMSPKKQSKS
jgi:hypothetical protein